MFNRIIDSTNQQISFTISQKSNPEKQEIFLVEYHRAIAKLLDYHSHSFIDVFEFLLVLL